MGQSRRGAVRGDEWFPEVPRVSGLEGGQAGEATA